MPDPTDAAHSRVAVITGGGSGIGRAVAIALADDAFRCVLVGRREDVLFDTADSLSTPGAHIAVDITEEGAAESIVGRIMAEHGRVDVVVHAAGTFEKREVGETDTAFWDDVLDLNLGAVMALTRAAWPHLCQVGGQVVLVSSIAAVQAFPGNSAYAASKGGMNALGEVLRLEGKDHGVRVITVCPGQTNTEIWDGKAPEPVRRRMMDPTSVGGLIAMLVALDRKVDIDPIVIRPMLDPWAADESDSSRP